MAEFKLGRIRFVWQGTWSAARTYYKDDVVKYGGKTYICTVGHTSNSDFNTDLDVIPSRWNLMADGQAWKNDWTATTLYDEGDLVQYGGNVYICVNGHTSAATESLGLENNSAAWQIFNEGLAWTGSWTVSRKYKINEIVQYGGLNYVCNAHHTSASSTAAGLEVNQSSWTVFTSGIDYKNEWTVGTRYKVNDVVKYGGGSWICVGSNTAGATFQGDVAYWNQFAEGIEYGGSWDLATSYQPGDIVTYGGNQYISKTTNTNSVPTTSTSNWDLFSEGLKYQSDWSIATSYKIGEVVKLGGSNYLAKTDSPSTAITVTAVDSVTKRFSTSSTTGMVVDMAIQFSGTTFGSVNPGGTYFIKTITPTAFTLSQSIGGATYSPNVSASGSMTATFAARPPSSSYWYLINSGINWRNDWTDDVEYLVGDSVKYGSNAYICVLSHRSEGDDGSSLYTQGGGDALSRPDLDVTGTYWKLLNVGSELSVLTTVGDMVYYGGAGPARLPIGTEGQILRVSEGGIPEWVSWGQTEHVYYVSPEGTDSSYPIWGRTLDKPWKSIRYACEQIEKGPRNPNAQYLLELNRAFIQREVTEWIDRQVSTNTAPFTSAFDYDEYKCERDTGFIVDRLIHDLGHGGNLKTLAAALAYVNALANGTIYATAADENGTGIYSRLSVEGTKDVAAYNYMLTLIEKVLNNQAPTVNYQVLNADNSTAIVSQFIDTDYVVEDGAIDTVTSLVGIVTTALTDQAATNLPERITPNNLVHVKTGSYLETLPIIVPAETCILGDEVRSVTVAPTGSLFDATDAYPSLTTFSRLSTVMGQIVAGTTVSKTTGNALTQDQQWPYASSVETTAVNSLVNVMTYQAAYRLSSMEIATSTDPTGYNTSYLIGYGDARKLVKENKKFLQEEVITYLQTNYSANRYGKTKTRRDVGYIVDAIVYSLTYGGNAMSIQAGLAYFDAEGSTNLIPASIKTLTLAAITFLKARMQSVATNSSITPLQSTVTQYRDTAGSAAASTLIGANVDIIYNLINGESTNYAPNITVTTITSTTTLATGTDHNLSVGDTFVPRTTANGLTSGTKYYVVSVPLSTTFTLAASHGGAAITTLTNGTGLTIVGDVVDQPAATNAVTTTTALIAAYTALSAQIPTIGTGAASTVTAAYPTLSYSTTKTARDVAIVLEAVGYDFMFDGNYRTVKAAMAYLRANSVELYTTTNLKAATRLALTYAKTQAKANVGGNATVQARIETLMTLVDDMIFGAADEGSVCQTELRSRDWACLQLERNRAFIVEETRAYVTNTFKSTVTASETTGDTLTCSSTSWMRRGMEIRFTGTVFGNIATNTTYYVYSIPSSTSFTIATTRTATSALDLATVASGSMIVSYNYNIDLCLRDVGLYIDAVKWDLKWTSNYKSRYVARYYANAILGSYEEDMYYLRNGTGIRNQTMSGLSGDLTPANAYNTSRTTAGAYCSLDPGWGPADFRAWIISRSPYVQNNATFGYAAIGQKIDGALHNGGNKSIVSNDFTQLISDGIGAWVTNNARAELVSVFSYYSHIGYLSENGGRIRGTNGNNSYGDFGSVAEGYDATETAITAVIDNKGFDAVVGSVLTDGVDAIYQFEYDNAGTDYTEAVWSVGGLGSGFTSVQDEFRDGAVFNIRLLDNVDDSTSAPEASGNFGGYQYLSNANTAQAGTTTQITIAAVDSEISSAYVGMKIVLTGGTAAGQFGIIATYSSATKIATVNKETTGTSGWDHVVPGTTITSPDASTTYVIEPRISFTAPSFSSTAKTLQTSQVYVDAAFAKTSKVYQSISGTSSGTGSGATFTIARKGTKYSGVTLVSGGTGYARLGTITISGTSLGGAATTNNLVITITSVNSSTGAVQTFEYAGVGAGGNFVALAQSSQTVNTSADGLTWTARTTVLPSASAWSAIANGDLTAVEVAGSFVVGRSYKIVSLGTTPWTSIGADAQLVGTYFIATGIGTGSGTASPVASHTVAVASTGTINAYSTDGGLTWTSGGGLPAGISGTAAAVTYGNGRWVTVGSSGATAYSINGGLNWVAGGALPAGTYTGVAYGKGVWVAVGTNVTAYSTDGGATWVAGTIAASNWIAVTFGNNRFVAVSNTSGTVAAYSLAGTAFTSSTITTAQYTDVHYGQGVFLAVSQSTQAASSEDGILWTSRTLSTAANGFSAAVHGNPNQTGYWMAVQRSTAGTVSSSILLGTTAKGRAYVADTKIYSVRITEPGSGYTVAPTMTITDPNNIYEAPFTVRIGNGALANPTITNSGTGYSAATATLDSGDGYADNFQSGAYISVKRFTDQPTAGANVVFGSQPNTVYKLVQVLSLSGNYPGEYGAFIQVSPRMTTYNSPADGTTVTTRIRYSQVRLTGHDFLNIGFGNFTNSNYPSAPLTGYGLTQANETVENNGGRVFFTSTDQDGNFRVGDLFTVEQSTGVATLNADAFNIAGLAELTLGSVTLGGNSATITEFSTDPFFTANSDSVVPTQKAIKTYIASQIGGGGASLNVNSIVAGYVAISGNQITTTTGGAIQMKGTFNFTSGVRGLPLAWGFYFT